MQHKPKVTVVGSYNQDLSVRTSRMPVRGETILGGPFITGPGGKGSNQAVAAARLGAEVAMVVKLGQDTFGDQAAANLVKEGILPDFIFRTQETHTGVAFIIVDDTGENMIVVAAGANNLLTPQDVKAARQAIVSADVLLVQLEVPLETVDYAVHLAREAGVKVVLNPAPGRLLPDDLLGKVDILTPNETEASLITGLPVGSLDEAAAAAEHLRGKGVGAVVVTLGGNGALVVDAAGARPIPGKRVEVVDTTGAGDAFSGSLAVSLAEGKSLDQAVTFSNVAAAIQVTRPGTAPAMPYRAEVESAL